MTQRNFRTRVPLLGLLAIGILVIAAAIISSSGGEDTSTSLADNASDAGVVDEVSFSGNFTRQEGPFSITGEVVVVTDATGTRILRLTDNFRTNVGSDVVVALRSADGEIRSLGPLTAESGQQDFAISEETDLTVWDEVLIWDNVGNVAFGSAFLTS